MNLLLISFIEAIYVIYMLNYFKTKYSIAHPFTYFNNKYLFHPIGISDKPKSTICQFGHDVSWLIALYFIVRGYLIHNNMFRNEINKINKIVLTLLIIGSFMNFNCVVYLIPIFVIEYFLILE